MLKQVLSKVANPGAEFRGAPFWAWNAKLGEHELRRQIRLLKQMGLGGFFMHARVGLGTEYLGKEWFDCVKACLDEAKKNDMQPWLYDEDRWPSGAAGSLVTKERKFARRELLMTTCDKLAQVPANILETSSKKTVIIGDHKTEYPCNEAKLLAIFSAKIDGLNACDVKREKTVPKTLLKGRVLLFFHCCVQPRSSWYNGESYLDTMNPEAVKKFVEVTHEAYRKEIGEEFGKSVPGIFTDEPNYKVDLGTKDCAWTENLPAIFQKRFGYSLIDHLPELYFFVDGKQVSKVRLDYRNLCTDLFVTAFSKTIGIWCGKNNMQMTGHVLCEDELLQQASAVGAAMRFYEYMQVPGIDLLTEHWGIFDTAKQCTSAAHQFGRPRRLSETYGCTGWDFPFAGHKALGDWQFALGINLRCQHLAWYSMDGEAKRDYPASISYQSPWYRHFAIVEDYFARLNAALSEGEERRDLLVIHPIESTFAWMPAYDIRHFEDPLFAGERWGLNKISSNIMAANIDFDYGDEEIMSRLGSVKNGRLQVCKAAYRAVLIPQLRTIRKTTLKLLQDFVAKGGFVGYYGTAPEYVDGVKSTAAKTAFKKFTAVKPENFSKAFTPAARIVSLTGPDGKEVEPLMHILKEDKDHLALFICNHAENFHQRNDDYPRVVERTLEFPEVKVSVKGKAGMRVLELDLTTGKLHKVDFAYQKGEYVFQSDFAPIASHLYILTAEEVAAEPPISALPAVQKTLVTLDGDWDITPDDFNALVLDHAKFRLDGGAEKPRTYFIKIDDELRKALDWESRGGAMKQPWVTGTLKPKRTLDLELTYEFTCQELPKTDCFLAVEHPELYDFQFNGKKISNAPVGWWCDICLKRLLIPAKAFKKGTNSLVLKGKYHQYLPGLESMFLLGQFGVAADGLAITAVPTALKAGDWCKQGLTNYSGNLTYRKTFLCNKPDDKRVLLNFPKWAGTALIVRVNNGKLRNLPWPPYTLDITDDLLEGQNVVEITVLSSRRNAFGPFYDKATWPEWSGPGQFKHYDCKTRHLVPCGLLAAPKIQVGK